MMDTMQFRDYIFPHNPKSITVTAAKNTAVLFCPGRGDVVQQLGGNARVARCVGSFFGESYEAAISQLEEFRRKAEKETAGTLFLPGISPFQAHLRELVFESSGDGKIIPYTMVFVEVEVGA